VLARNLLSHTELDELLTPADPTITDV